MICSKANLLQELINANIKPCDIESINVSHQAVFVRLKDETHEDRKHLADILGDIPRISFDGITWYDNTASTITTNTVSWNDLATTVTGPSNWTATTTASNIWATLNRTNGVYWYGTEG